MATQSPSPTVPSHYDDDDTDFNNFSPERRALLAQLSSLTKTGKVSPQLWAMLQLCDINVLRTLVLELSRDSLQDPFAVDRVFDNLIFYACQMKSRSCSSSSLKHNTTQKLRWPP